jgi:excinuclease ABC subunit B
MAYNDEYGIIPKTIIKEIRAPIHNSDSEIEDAIQLTKKGSKKQIEQKIKQLEKDMRNAAKVFDFEKAAELRDIILELKAEIYN